MKYNFSIIIPHHNIPQLLERNLASIPKREDVQVIVVDDKSDATVVDELKRLQNTYQYVDFLFSSENKGGGAARNLGLQYAHGKYVLFADADDFFLPSISSVFDDYQTSDADIIFFDAISVDTDTYRIRSRARRLNMMHIQYKKKPLVAENRLRYEFGEPWCKLIKKDIITNCHIQFDECRIHNDTKFSYLVGFYCKTCIVDKRALYCVTDRQNSVSKGNTNEKMYIRTKTFSEANRFYKLHNIKLFEERSMRPMMSYLMHFKWEEYKICKKILLDAGMSNKEILLRELSYPYLMCKKIWLNCQEIVYFFLHGVK